MGGEDVDVMHVCAVCGWVERMWRLCMCVLYVGGWDGGWIGCGGYACVCCVSWQLGG